MFRELQSLFNLTGGSWNIVGGGSGKGGGDDKDGGSGKSDEPDNDPFDNFDFSRFRPRNTGGPNRPGQNSPGGSSKDEPPRENKEPVRPGFDINDLLNSGSFGGGRGGRTGQPLPEIRLPRPSRRSIFIFIVGLLLVLLFIALPALSGLYTDALWFNEVGQSNLFWTRIWVRLAIFGVAALVTFSLIMLNVYFSRRIGPRGPLITAPDNPLAAIIGGSVRLLNWVFIAGALVLSFILAGAASAAWETVLQFLNAAPWTDTEKIFNQTVGYYVFELPFFSFIQGWLVGLFIITLVAVGLVYALNFALSGQRFQFTQGIKTHITILGAVILGLFAWGYQISNSKLVYSPRGVVPGASATDIEAQVPANNILTVLVGLAALALLANIFIRNPRTGVGLLVGAVTLWLVSTILVGSIYPNLVQSISIRPNEITKETPYIQNTISQTRKGFNLDQIQTVQFGGTAQLTAQDISSNPVIEPNVRLWDYNKIQTVYDQKETLRRYYDFKDVDIDRYDLDVNNTGQTRETQVMLSARELKVENLDPRSQTWQSKHLQFTHGYGLQASPVNKVDPQGYPVNLITQNFPISSTGALKVTQPRIYYGTGFSNPDEYGIVDTSLQEIDYPFTSGSEDGKSATFSYDGKGGIKLDSFLTKAAFWLKLGDFNLLISDALNTNSRLLWRRNIQERARMIAPFLSYDHDPYLVIADGRLYFIQDAYTYTNLYPHSDGLSRSGGINSGVGPSSINYIRNSVKVVTDAYDGKISFYMVETGGPDPIVQTYARIYPDLFKPASAMPPSLLPHLRYPEDLFRIQSTVYQTYHVTDAVSYYNKQDQWQIPADPRTEASNGTFEPFYLVTQLPNEKAAEFVLIQPFTPQGKNNLVSWMAARSDGSNYGKLVAYNFQGAVNVFGPGQFYSAVNGDQEFSRSRTLLNTNGSQLQTGPLLIIPVDKAVLYVLPYYLVGTGNPIPKLQFVAVSANNQVIVRSNLQEALSQVLTSGTAVDPTQLGSSKPNASPATGSPGIRTSPGTVSPPAAGSSPNSANTTVVPGTTPGTVAELRRSLAGHLDRAKAATATGDKATADSELSAAQQDLDRLNRLLGQ